MLVVDDEANIRKVLVACVEAEGHHAAAVGTAADAVLAARRRSFDLAFIDLQLGAEKGMDLLPALLDGRRARQRPAGSWTGDRDANVLGGRPSHRSHDCPCWPVPRAPGNREAISCLCRRHNIASNTTGSPVC